MHDLYTELRKGTTNSTNRVILVDSHSATQEIIRLLVNLKIHSRVHKRPPLVSILSQMNLVHAVSSYFLNKL
jgi:hypothetical protein